MTVSGTTTLLDDEVVMPEHDEVILRYWIDL